MKSLRQLATFRLRGVSANGAAADTSFQNDSHPPQQAPQQADAAQPVHASASNTLTSLSGVRSLPRPAIKWIGAAGRIALRELDFAADADAVCDWQEETYKSNFTDFRYTDSFAAAFRHDLRRAALDPHHGLFVLDDGAPIGFLWLVICENTWTRERYGYINNIYISSSRRSLGLAADLMAHADDWFRKRSIKSARLTVTVSNEAACKLYERCGYRVTRREMEKDL